MSESVSTASTVGFAPDAVRIGGESVILLSASLFYFRIPRESWRERMNQVKAMGYNSIDVYFPWNYHERREGEWDFSGDRDVETFLRQAAEAGLWVIARPGPYICSEWDGGALPAYLFAKPGMKLRDNDPQFLRYVSEWFGRILPILKRFEVGSGGSVICAQLDNELDFYGCSDPHGYIKGLRDLAVACGISVPLIACAGQGGLLEASGLTDGVVPTCNFYPDDRDPEFERKVLHYRGVLAERGYPLLVTETNRSHFLLRRLLSSGAKLLGPYLQVSGTNFGFTNATNNWGNPLAFLTSDYDFGGMVSPDGQIREEAYEGRLLGRLIGTYGSALAEALPEPITGWQFADTPDAGLFGPFELRLKGGGSLLFVTNGSGAMKEAVLVEAAGRRIPDSGFITLAEDRSLALPVDVPMARWGMRGSLVYSTAELFMAEGREEGTMLAFHAEGSGDMMLALPSPFEFAEDGLSAERQEGGIRIRFSGAGTQSCTISMADGKKLILVIAERFKALQCEGISSSGTLAFREQTLEAPDDESWAVSDWRMTEIDAAAPFGEAVAVAQDLEKADHLERLGVYRGYAWYESAAALPAGKRVHGILVRGASDILSLYVGGRYAGTAVPGGVSVFMPIDGPMEASKSQKSRLNAKVEIWGHTNFDDIRLPGLRLNALKGLRGMAAVTRVLDITSNWSVSRAADSAYETGEEGMGGSLRPIVSFGGWLSADHPANEIYRRVFDTASDANTWTVHFKGIQSLARIIVNGRDAGEVNPFDPYVDITSFVVPGERVELVVYLQRLLGLPAGRVLVYEGTEVQGFTVSAAEERELATGAQAAQRDGLAAALPLELAPGGAAWLSGSVRNSRGGNGWRVKAVGTGLKLTAIFAERIVGRIWLPGGAARPVMTGGSPDSFCLPGPWFGANPENVTILLEAVDAESPGRLTSLEFIP
ncbi:beta-galactosidase [Cohnella sp. CFH 77786]|uniref:beta-galactosidase n=1 Tax=Cohnella sp. CFH 77786 TaxID=2662265 RepID=UPI001C60A498|nr:beta-galactosidase [Cohnella sp. CFH 77786]